MAERSDSTSLGDVMRARRRALHVSQDELADLAGTSVRFVRDLEHGKTTVRLDKVLAVLDALGLEMRTDVRRP